MEVQKNADSRSEGGATQYIRPRQSSCLLPNLRLRSRLRSSNPTLYPLSGLLPCRPIDALMSTQVIFNQSSASSKTGCLYVNSFAGLLVAPT